MMNHRDYVVAALRHEETDRVPYTLGFEGGTDKELDAYYGCADWRARVQECMVSLGGVDTVGERPLDDTHGIDAFGSIWRRDKLPWHLEKPAMAEPSFSGVRWPTVDDFPAYCAPNVNELTGPGAERFSLLHSGWGLFEHSRRLRGFENRRTGSIAEPDFYAELLDRLTDLRLAMISEFRPIPADAVMFGDDWGDQRGVILGPERWRHFLKPRWAKVYAAVHAQGKLVISHCCGSVADILPDLIEIGLDGLESVQPEPRGMSPFELKAKYGDERLARHNFENARRRGCHRWKCGDGPELRPRIVAGKGRATRWHGLINTAGVTGRVGNGGGRTADGAHPIFQRLTQDLEHAPLKFRQLVQEEGVGARQVDFPWPGNRSSPDHACVRDGVVGAPERSVGKQGCLPRKQSTDGE